MKTLNLIMTLLLFLMIALSGCEKDSAEGQNDLPISQGDSNYFGQIPPGNIPEIFAPDIISKSNRNEYNPIFSPDGNAFYFTVTDEVNWNPCYIMVSNYENHQWTNPQKLILPGKALDWGNCFSPDGNTMFFNSADSNWDIDIYSIKKSGEQWIEPILLNSTINSVGSAIATSVSTDGTLYFRSSIGNFSSNINEIFYSPLVEGSYDTLYSIGAPINTRSPEDYPTISPDGNYLIFYRNRNIFISFKKENGEWTEPVGMGLEVSGGQTGGGSITPDNKYFIYQGPGKDIYWVELENIVDSLRNLN